MYVVLLMWQVRVNALLCLGDMISVLDKPAILEILQTIARCTAVDRSAPTLMCTLGVANSILKQVQHSLLFSHIAILFLSFFRQLTFLLFLLFSMELTLSLSMFFL